jgi:hypothetical protein
MFAPALKSVVLLLRDVYQEFDILSGVEWRSMIRRPHS